MSASLRPAAPPPRLRLRVRGAVQGVGFRPFAYGLARRLDLAGFALNDGEGVILEVEGPRAAEFAAALPREAPALARIDTLDIEAIAPTAEAGFRILASRPGAVRTRIPPDIAPCADCLRDLFDPLSRFYRYPFISCAQCGPRFTITRQLPYDRAQTSMAGFAMCPDCARDYADPANRRFHAEPIACPACGPRLSHSLPEIAAGLRAGSIVALKGIGGFHLLADARNDAAVARLRRRKQREAKPFAVMLADLDAVQDLADASPAERALIAGPARPIVLQRARAGLAPSVAPGLRELGIMLPAAPLHHLLFAELGRGFALVATSANPGGEPLVIDDADAAARLGGIADLVVTHDRAIVTRADDSVMAVIDGAPAWLRRGRGAVPEPVMLAADGPPVLALGAHLKTTVTVLRGTQAFVSQHVGSLDNAPTIRFLAETADHLLALLDVRPAAIACDLHPDFASTRLAHALGARFGVPVIPVQHHAAHLAAIAAEHGVTGPLRGAVLDGHGAGPDGEAWGGELLELDGASCTRIGHLAELALPGGDRAARQPWRMALAALARLGRLDDAARRFPTVPEAPALARLLRAGAFPATSSAGRWFDAAAALLGLCTVQDYESQAALLLQARAGATPSHTARCSLEDNVLDPLPLLAALADGIAADAGATLFHTGLAAGIVDWIAAEHPAQAALAGGCFANRILAEAVAQGLRSRGITPLLAQTVPAGDGGLSLGQASMARAALGMGVGT